MSQSLTWPVIASMVITARNAHNNVDALIRAPRNTHPSDAAYRDSLEEAVNSERLAARSLQDCARVMSGYDGHLVDALAAAAMECSRMHTRMCTPLIAAITRQEVLRG